MTDCNCLVILNAFLRFCPVGCVLMGGFLLCSMLASCDLDPFGFSRKIIVGDYELEYFLDGNCYYLNKKHSDQQGGVFEATIEQIGWSKEVIVCRVRKQFRGDKDGVYSIEVDTGRITGPIEPAALAASEQLNSIKLENAKTVFDRL